MARKLSVLVFSPGLSPEFLTQKENIVAIK